MRNHVSRMLAGAVFLSLWAFVPARAENAPSPFETLFLSDGSKLKGRLTLTPGANPVFQAEFAQWPTPLEPGMTLLFETAPIEFLSGIPPFRAEFGRGQQLSGRLESLTADRLTMVDPVDNAKILVARGGLQALIQRPGEVQAFQDGFEILDQGRWTMVGESSIAADRKKAGEHSLRLPSDGASLTHEIENSFPSGRLDLAFYDDGQVAAGRQWGVDLAFKSQTGTQSLRVILGWSEDVFGLESPGVTSLRIQRLLRNPGWHRLTVRFNSEHSEIAIDGNELAYGKDLKGALTEIRLASYPSHNAERAEGVAGYIDDLRLIRQDEPVSGLEVDITQDEIRLTAGDQVFGTELTANPDRIDFKLDGRPTTIPWSEISGLHLKRSPAQGTEIEGLPARVEWQAAPGDDPRDRNILEGAILELSETSLTLQTAYVGTLKIPRGRLRRIQLIDNKRTHRIEIDPKAHHLGNEVSIAEPILDPPQNEGGVLERAFDLATIPASSVFLVVDALDVVGEAPGLRFSSQVKKGELRTNLKINGTPFDYLNRVVTSQNKSSERFRYPIPKDQLKIGKNVVRFEQVGDVNDPNYLDDLGLLGIAIEYD